MTDQGPRRIPRHAFKDSYYPGSALNYENRNKCGVLGCGLGYEAPVHWILDEVVTPLEEEKPKLTVEVVESTFTENESAPWPGPKPSTFSMPDLGANTSVGHEDRDKGWNRVNEPEPERETPRPKVRVDTSYFNPLKPDDDEQAVVEAKLRVAFERWRAHSAAIDKNLGGDAECGNPAHLLEELRRQGLRLVLK